MDMQCTMVWTGLPLKSIHGGVLCCAGMVTGNAKTLFNADAGLTLNGVTSNTYARLDDMLERADELAQ